MKDVLNAMNNIKQNNLKVTRITNAEFELGNGDVYPIPFELDNEKLCKHNVYLGKRVKRGLFKSSSGKLMLI